MGFTELSGKKDDGYIEPANLPERNEKLEKLKESKNKDKEPLSALTTQGHAVSVDEMLNHYLDEMLDTNDEEEIAEKFNHALKLKAEEKRAAESEYLDVSVFENQEFEYDEFALQDLIENNIEDECTQKEGLQPHSCVVPIIEEKLELNELETSESTTSV